MEKEFYHRQNEVPQKLCLVLSDQVKTYNEQIELLKKRKQKLKSEQRNELAFVQENNRVKLEELNIKQSATLNQKLQKLQKLQQEKSEYDKLNQEELSQYQETLDLDYQKRETNLKASLKTEISKYYSLREYIQQEKVKFETYVEEMLKKHQEQLDLLQKDFKEQLTSDQETYQALLTQAKTESKDFEAQLKSLENLSEREVCSVQNEMLSEKQKEHQKSLQKWEDLQSQKKIKQQTKALKLAEETKYQELKGRNNWLINQVESLREKMNKTEEQLRERDEVISRKEATVQELKASNIHLMNFHFVLNQKIQHLKSQRNPLENQLDEKEEAIKNIYNELVQKVNQKNKYLSKNDEYREKNLSVQTYNNRLKSQIFASKKKLTMLKSDLADLVKTTQKEELIYKLRELYEKHAELQEVDTDSAQETQDIKGNIEEANLQKSQKGILNYHESIKGKLESASKNTQNFQKEKKQAIVKKQRENAFLIKECNSLRNENKEIEKTLKNLQREIKDLTLQLELNPISYSKVQKSNSLPKVKLNPYEQRKLQNNAQFSSIISKLDKNSKQFAQETQEFKKLGKKFQFYLKGFSSPNNTAPKP